MSKKLTIGMATYDDYDGVYFTIQSLRMYHNLKEDDVNFIVIDNNPSGKHGETTKKFVENAVKGKYVPFTSKNTSFVKYKIFDYSDSEYTICLDSHVMILQNGISHLVNYFEKNVENQKNLVQGPLLYDDLKNTSTHFDPIWRNSMYGTWAKNEELLKKGEPFEIGMQGMGMLACKTDAFPRINQNFLGFGGEEWYIQEKFRMGGGKVVCLPELKWMHRFGRPNGVPFSLKIEERIWNYFIGWLEIYQDPNHEMVLSIREHFKDKVSPKIMEDLFLAAKSVVFDGKNLSDHDDLFVKKPEQAKTQSHIPSIPTIPITKTTNGSMMEKDLKTKFESLIKEKSDINEHLETLRKLSSECEKVVELGVRGANSTVALILGKPKRIDSFDLNEIPQELNGFLSGCSKNMSVDWRFHRENCLFTDKITECDMMFIDTWHTFKQLSCELHLHSHKVKKYIVLHDTVTYGEVDENLRINEQSLGGDLLEFYSKLPEKKGLMPSVQDFLTNHKNWVIKKIYKNNNGLLVLEKLVK